MGGGGDSGGDSTVRYAPYLESAHGRILDHEGSDEPEISFMDAFNAAQGTSPYGAYEQIDVDEGYFGMRTDDASLTYEARNFPSLWDMFGKFMGGLDVHDLWGQIYDDIVKGPEIENAVSAQSALIQDDIDTTVLPKFVAGMRDINSVQATTFVIGKSIIQDAHVKAINKFASQLRVHTITISNDQWAKHLEWNTSVVSTFSEMFKLYYSSKLDMDRTNLEYQAKDNMWDINLFENARAIIGAIGGTAATTAGGGNEPSQTSKALGGAMSGASAGYMATGGNPYGAVIGGVIGLAASFL